MESDYVFLTAPGLIVDELTRSEAAAFARAGDYDVVDLWPAGLPAANAATIALVDPDIYAKHRFAEGRTACQAMIARREIVERSGVEQPVDPVSFSRIAKRLKRYSRRYGVAIAPGLKGQPLDCRWRISFMSLRLGLFAPFAVVIGVLSAILPLVIWRWAGRKGFLVLASAQLVPVLATAGTPLAPTGVASAGVFHLPAELWRWAKALIAPRKPPSRDSEERDRERYREFAFGGIDRFLEARITTCPMCGSDQLVTHLRSHDVIQQKPGEFALERCTSCGHIFQNPPLNDEGLSFYYRDLYDGLHSEPSQSIFEMDENAYTVRANLVEGLGQPPRKWLDVGTGFGYFCAVAKGIWPETSFDGLDQGEGITEAERRGWVDRGFHGQFRDHVETLAGEYDVVSMSHYIEHTRNPSAEISAARRVLKPGGLLLIEVPNPYCAVNRLLGRWWLSWLQPQHLHFINQENFTRMFAANGFSVIKWYWPRSLPDLTSALFLFLTNLAPPDEPWHPRRALPWRIYRGAVWAMAPAILLPGILFDFTAGRILERKPHTTNYGVVARLDLEGRQGMDPGRSAELREGQVIAGAADRR